MSMSMSMERCVSPAKKCYHTIITARTIICTHFASDEVGCCTADASYWLFLSIVAVRNIDMNVKTLPHPNAAMVYLSLDLPVTDSSGGGGSFY
jgi:hypothetical protein